MAMTRMTVGMKSFLRNSSAERIPFSEPFSTQNTNHHILPPHPRHLGVIWMVFSCQGLLPSRPEFRIPSLLALYWKIRPRCSLMPSSYDSIHLSIYSIHNYTQSVMCAQSAPFYSLRLSLLGVNFLSQASIKSVSTSHMNWQSARSLRGGSGSK